MAAIQIKIVQFPLGELILGSFGGALVLCDWRYRKMRNTIDRRISRGLGAELEVGTSSVISYAIEELEAYFAGRLIVFKTPLHPVGTQFQLSVWVALQKIDYGKTLSYLELSKNIENEGAIRAVASANGANALSIFIPCHRVIGSNGSLTGYAGGLPAKKKLLQLEGAKISQQVELF